MDKLTKASSRSTSRAAPKAQKGRKSRYMGNRRTQAAIRMEKTREIPLPHLPLVLRKENFAGIKKMQIASQQRKNISRNRMLEEE